MEDKVLVRIPSDPLNPEIKTAKVILNGYCYEIELGKEVLVPKEVKNILEQSGKLR